MTKIMANVDKMNLAKNDLSLARSELYAIKGRLEECRDDIALNWEGRAADYFKAKLEGYRNEVTGIIKAIDGLNTSISSSGDLLQQIDNMLNNIMSFFAEFSAKVGG